MRFVFASQFSVAARSAVVCGDAGGAPTAGVPPPPHAAAAAAAIVASRSIAVGRFVMFICVPSLAARVCALGLRHTLGTRGHGSHRCCPPAVTGLALMPAAPGGMTRELAVLALMAEGRSNHAIA